VLQLLLGQGPPSLQARLRPFWRVLQRVWLQVRQPSSRGQLLWVPVQLFWPLQLWVQQLSWQALPLLGRLAWLVPRPSWQAQLLSLPVRRLSQVQLLCWLVQRPWQVSQPFLPLVQQLWVLPPSWQRVPQPWRLRLSSRVRPLSSRVHSSQRVQIFLLWPCCYLQEWVAKNVSVRVVGALKRFSAPLAG
jgi:hypothetical protein